MYNTVRIKDLPEDERPRERLRKYGPENLKDSDLLAIILKSGFKGTTAIQLGEQILVAFEGDLKRMADNKSKQYEKIKGVGEAKKSLQRLNLESDWHVSTPSGIRLPHQAMSPT